MGDFQKKMKTKCDKGVKIRITYLVKISLKHYRYYIEF